ncbi:transcription factor E2F4 [Pleurodeles waltl]|uniref:transcription factor E2F4 n=1 Tax=Pleurodeles waltl TaxID=8319 RepID=UPI0037099063
MADSAQQLPATPSRHEKSLGLLTTKFVSLLQEAKDGVLDLKVAADTLAVRQKRRIYDITNVLEGIGLIEKKSKNSIQWKGVGPGCNTREIADKLIDLKTELADLEQREQELDQQRIWVQQSIKNVTDDVLNSRLSYVTHEDICMCFKGDTLLAIRAPSGTRLEVPIPEGLNGQRKYQIHLKSTTGPIEVLLVNKDAYNSTPVVVPVPPPEDLIQCHSTATPAQPAVTSSPQRPSLTQQQDSTEATKSQSAEHSPQSSHSPRTPTNRSTGPRFAAAESQSRSSTNSTLSFDSPSPTSTKSPGTSLDTQPLQSSASLDSCTTLPNSSTSFVPIKSEPSELLEFPKDLSDMFDPTKECLASDLLEELMSSEVFIPLLRLSPPPGDHDYIYNLDESEGVCDLFDVPNLPL